MATLKESIIGVVAGAAAVERGKIIELYLQQSKTAQPDVGAVVSTVLPNGQVKATIANQEVTINNGARQLRAGDVITNYGGRAW